MAAAPPAAPPVQQPEQGEATTQNNATATLKPPSAIPSALTTSRNRHVSTSSMGLSSPISHTPPPEKLPAGWEKRESRSQPGRFYYVNTATGKKTWTLPGAKDAGGSAKKERLGPKDFRLGSLLGEGAFAHVVHVKHATNGKEFALKILQKKFIIQQKKEKYVLAERNIMAKLRHPNCVKLHFTFRDEAYLYYGMDLCRGGELLNVINNAMHKHKEAGVEDKALPPALVRFYAAELVNVLSYLHDDLGVIHRDMKPENLLLNEKGHLMVVDFGTAKDTRSRQKSTTFCGTAEYVSPEVLRDAEADRGADIWAFGVILFQMLTGKWPFRGENEYQTFSLIMNHPEKPAFEYPAWMGGKADDADEEVRCGANAKDVMKRIFVQRPELRLGGTPPKWISVSTSASTAAAAAEGEAAAPAAGGANEEGAAAAAGGDVGGKEEVDNSYNALKSHPLFEGIHWKTLAESKAPMLPDVEALPEISDEAGTVEDFEGLLCQAELVGSEEWSAVPVKTAEDDDDEWMEFLDKDGGEKVILSGLIWKKRHLFSKRRQLLLTNKPRLMYIDPETNIKKGEIPWSLKLRVVVKGLRHFDVVTPGRTYYLTDMLGDAQRWADGIGRIVAEQIAGQ